MKKKDSLNEILLSVGTEIARIRGKEDMLHLIRNTIKQYIDFNDSFIFRYDKHTRSSRCYIYYAEKGFTQNPEFISHLRFEYTTDNDSIDDPPLPVVRDVEVLMTSEMNKVAFIRDASKAGIKEYVSVKLIEGNQLIGFLLLLSKQKNSFTTDHLNLLERIKIPIAIATANIIANEEIAKKEEEKIILLSLSTEIAAIRNRKDFFEVVNLRLKTLFDIKEFGIAQINEDRKTYSAFILELGKKIIRDTEFDRITSAKYPVTDPVFSILMNSEYPVIFDVESIVDDPLIPDYVRFWKKVGLQRVLGIALRESRKNIGCIFLHIDGNETLDIKSKLLSGVCAQLAVKISDILAREEIEKREEEKSKLLSFSNALASIVDRKQLSICFTEELRKFGIIGNYGISILTEDKKHLETILYDQNDDSVNDPEFKRVLETPFEISEALSGVILNSDQPVTFKIQELKERKIMLPCIDWWYRTGVQELTGIAIQLGEKPIGFFWLGSVEVYDKESHYPLLKSISSQIGIALSNLLANEKIVSQLNEIKKYKEQLEEEKIYLQEEIETSQNYSEIIGESKEIKKVYKMIAQVAHSDSTVLLLGETGTGKELIARAIHNNSARAGKLMVKVNCAALSAHLVESELFGHEKGSFTGAFEKRIGRFELANKGTLFLDEIGEMPMDLQVKLLRALQEKEIERVGGKTTIKTDVRIIAATNRDLEKLMEEGKFRSDIYYRLNIFPIVLPPLRNRREDIPQLTTYFIDRYSKKAGKKIKTIHHRAMQELAQYDWPGNIRELEHLIERSVLLANGDTIKEINLPQKKKEFSTDQAKEDADIKTIDQKEKEYILKVLKHVNGRIGGAGGAAELLGLPTSTLNSRMKKLGIRKEHLG